MSDRTEANPFSALLAASEADTKGNTNQNELPITVENPSLVENTSPLVSNKTNEPDENAARINDIAEDIFAITLNSSKYNDTSSARPGHIQVVYLEELATSLNPQKHIDMETLEQALFERLLISDVIPFVLPKGCKSYDDRVILNKVVLYLHAAFDRLKQHLFSGDIFTKTIANQMKELILRNVVTAMQQPALFEDQVLWQQWFEIMKDCLDVGNKMDDFLAESISRLISEDDGFTVLESVFTPLLVHVHKSASCASLVNMERWVMSVLSMFASNVHLAGVLLNYAQPKGTAGRAYGDTIFGAILSLSILPKTATGAYEYFDSPLDQMQSSMEGTLWVALDAISVSMHGIFLSLLRHGQRIRVRTLEWIADCLSKNSNRGQLWNTQVLEMNPAVTTCASDAFMLNLAAVLLRMCRPFCNDYKDSKILKIDPTYCAVEDTDGESRGVNTKGLSNDTCLLPPLENISRLKATSYSFTTECFFMTHKCLDLGYRVCVERLTRQNQDIARIQRAYTDARNQGSPAAEALLQRMTQDMTKYLSLRSTLFEPSLVQHLSMLHSATAVWLSQVAVNATVNDENNLSKESYAPIIYRDITFPLTDNVPNTLRCIPEFVIENTIGFSPFCRHFKSSAGVDQPITFLEPILTLVLIFMGTNNRMKNPHLRAKLAECLESLLPTLKDDVPGSANQLNMFYRERLFKEHPHRMQIIPSLIHVFVSIEVTGESVQFEQKFNYRRPMYVVMHYLWNIDEHRQCFKMLSEEAEANMEAVTPPLFLRFVNLLLNDAVFLLDESLSNMSQLRTMQAARTNGDWNNLPPREREQNNANMHHIGMMARFDNILGRETIQTIQQLTTEVRGVFCHSSMVDRVASMLNYFLLHLVGPNSKNFKVKDGQDYDFDPANTVLNICRIYVHLSDNEAFCLAVSQDGRSFSPQLFTLAEDVLVRIGGGALICDLQTVATKVNELAKKQQRVEEALAEAPEEFLDPIMSTLMTDPVILPSSRTTVDRTTIARHLLSDQTDPFNRSPLTMCEIKSNVELKQKIQDWIAEKNKIADAVNEEST